MFLNVDKIENAIFGAVCSEKCNEGTKFYKCTEKARNAWEARAEQLHKNSLTPTGIRLDIETDSELFAFKAYTKGEFDVLVDGSIIYRTSNGELLPSGESKCFELGKGKKRITLAFPSHDPSVEFCGITLSDGAEFEPHKYDGKMLFIGDSITQGWNAGYSSLSFAWQTMLRLNVDCVVNGIGGAYYDEDTFDDTDFAPDTVVVAYGTNDYCGGNSTETISKNCNAFLKRVKEKYADKRVVVILPIWSERYNKPEEHGSIEDCRKAIEERAKSFGFEVFDGTYAVPHSSDFYFDELHPNALGFCLYANKLIDFLTK